MKKFFGWILLILGCFLWMVIMETLSGSTLISWILMSTPIIVLGAIFANISNRILLIPSSIFYIVAFMSLFMDDKNWFVTSSIWFLGSMPLFVVGIILLNKNKGNNVKQKDIKKLEELENLLKNNLITEQEYKEKRKSIID